MTMLDELLGLDVWAIKRAGLFRKTHMEVVKGVAFSAGLVTL